MNESVKSLIHLLGDLSAGIYRDEITNNSHPELIERLLKCIHHFDAYNWYPLDDYSKILTSQYIILLISAAYFLCGIKSSSKLVARRINYFLDLDGEGLENLLIWILQDDIKKAIKIIGPFELLINEISKQIVSLVNGKYEHQTKLLELGNMLRKSVYTYGTPRQLLLGDIIAAVIKNKCGG